MKQYIRILVAVLALAGVIAWTIFMAKVWQFGNSFKGMGDGAGTESASAGDGLLGVLLIGAIWLLPASPYLCMAAGSLNLIAGKSLRVAYVYSLVVLTLMTLIELVAFHRAFKLIALGNIVAGGLWAYAFRGNTAEKSETPV